MPTATVIPLPRPRFRNLATLGHCITPKDVGEDILKLLCPLTF
jgi:hypothetical protein